MLYALINLFGLNGATVQGLVWCTSILSTGLRNELCSDLVASIPHGRESVFSMPLASPV